MKKGTLLVLAAVAVFVETKVVKVEKNETVNKTKDVVAAECDPYSCQLPYCRCSSTKIPGRLDPNDVPQFVTVTFDDAININNIETYRRVLYNRRNSNGCNAGATFYVSHEYTNYQGVNELYNKGFEIALHSISHQTPQTYWSGATYDDMVREFGNQKQQIAHFANIPIDSLQGIRMPFLQMTGNAGFKMMADYNITYDSSWPTVTYRDPGMWPYTLDYKSTQECIVPPCPTASFPGTWVIPIISWTDLCGTPCSFVDACYYTPDNTDEEGWYEFILSNFGRHYRGNRSPFGFYIHEWFLSTHPAVEKALIRFLDLVNNLYDAFVVNTGEIIEWVKNPVPVKDYRVEACRQVHRTTCKASSCGPLRGEHNNMEYWMQVCSECPRVYPWLNNHLGK